VFSDASEMVFAAVVYIRVEHIGGIDINILGAKTRVAPNKRTLSIPRLELQSFVLGCRWTRCLLKLLETKVENIYHWTDSKTVIAWINSEQRKYTKFVELRISEVLEYMDEFSHTKVRYVPSKLNPADQATKWSKPVDFSKTSSWLNGPEFLRLSPDNWPELHPTTSNEIELKTVLIHMNSTKTEFAAFEFTNFSSFRKLTAVTAWILRYKSNLQRKAQGKPLYLHDWPSCWEIRKARNYLIRKAQNECYHEELHDLQKISETSSPTNQNMNSVSKSSSLFKLTPILEDGIIRVGGANWIGKIYKARHEISCNIKKRSPIY
jgi:hypothetical protein